MIIVLSLFLKSPLKVRQCVLLALQKLFLKCLRLQNWQIFKKQHCQISNNFAKKVEESYTDIFSRITSTIKKVFKKYAVKTVDLQEIFLKNLLFVNIQNLMIYCKEVSDLKKKLSYEFHIIYGRPLKNILQNFTIVSMIDFQKIFLTNPRSQS